MSVWERVSRIIGESETGNNMEGSGDDLIWSSVPEFFLERVIKLWTVSLKKEKGKTVTNCYNHTCIPN